MGKRKAKIYKEIYYSEEEWEIVKENFEKSGLRDISKYIRKISVDGKIVIQDFKTTQEVNHQIMKIGANINQVAKKVNQNNYAYSEDVEELKKEFEELKKNVIKFMESMLWHT